MVYNSFISPVRASHSRKIKKRTKLMVAPFENYRKGTKVVYLLYGVRRRCEKDDVLGGLDRPNGAVLEDLEGLVFP